jgi:hypothetical protein
MSADGSALSYRLREHAELVAASVLLDNQRRWGAMTAADMQRIEYLAHEVAARMLSEAVRRAERAPEAQRRALAELFGLDQSSSDRRRIRVKV